MSPGKLLGPAEVLASHMQELFDLVESKPFPFRRCRGCENVFVRDRNRRYCDAACAARTAETADRKDKRNAYMKAYMKERRKKAARARRKKRER